MYRNKLQSLIARGVIHLNDGDGEGGGSGGGEGPTLEELQTQLADATKSVEGLTAKNQELLTETKAAKSARREIEATAQAEQERIAQAEGNHEQLYKSAMEKNTDLQSRLDDVLGSVANEKRDNAAMKIAGELADGSNAELLSEFISRRLKFTDEGLKVTDANGQLTISSLGDLATEFKNDARYSALLKGNQSSGGGATGGSNSGGAAKVKTRAEFEALNPIAKSNFMKDGGSLVN